jgi:hypothetical protein
MSAGLFVRENQAVLTGQTRAVRGLLILKLTS